MGFKLKEKELLIHNKATSALGVWKQTNSRFNKLRGKSNYEPCTSL